MDLQIEVVEVKGKCATHQAGDKYILKDGFKLVAKIPICMHGLAAILPFYNALRYVPGNRFGLDSKDEPNAAFVQCPDACDHTNGGTAVYKIEVIS